METIMLYWNYIGTMENKMETIGILVIISIYSGYTGVT